LFYIYLYFLGPRYRRPKQPKDKTNDEKRPRTAFSSEQLARLKVSITIHTTIKKKPQNIAKNLKTFYF